jgi:protein-disulfide isomerase/uncharacterized membrane protein
VRQVHWIALIRVLVLLALAASAVLYVDYTSPAAAFCSPGSGCAVVRASRFGRLVVGETVIPVPVFGLLGFGLLYAATLLPKAELRNPATVLLSTFGGLGGLIFLALQAFVVKRFCLFCVLVDTFALATLVAAWLFWKSTREATRQPESRGKSKRPPPPEILRPGAWILLAAIAVAAPLAWPEVRPQPPVPPKVAALYQSGKVNVVEFADYECPFCRLLHFRLKALFKEYGDRVNFVRLNLPLQSHEHARDAARAGLCAEDQGRGEQMADVLFAAEDLRPAANREAAKKLGLDLAKFDACVASPETDQRIDAQAQILRDAGFEGLPTTFVGGVKIVGAQKDEVFRDALARAGRGEGETGIPAPLFGGLLGVAVAVVVGMGRERGGRKR